MAPVPGFRPGRADQTLTENAPKPLSSTPIALGQRQFYPIEDGIDHLLDMSVVQVRIFLSDALNQFGFDHNIPPRSKLAGRV